MIEDVDVVLRDGTTLRLRPAAAGDEHALTAMFEQLSPERRYFRCFGARATPGLIAQLLAANGRDEFTLVAEYGGRVVAVAQYARLPEAPTTAEAASAVADEMQRRGVGTRLREQLAAHARAPGLTAFRALGAGRESSDAAGLPGFGLRGPVKTSIGGKSRSQNTIGPA